MWKSPTLTASGSPQARWATSAAVHTPIPGTLRSSSRPGPAQLAGPLQPVRDGGGGQQRAPAGGVDPGPVPLPVRDGPHRRRVGGTRMPATPAGPGAGSPNASTARATSGGPPPRSPSAPAQPAAARPRPAGGAEPQPGQPPAGLGDQRVVRDEAGVVVRAEQRGTPSSATRHRAPGRGQHPAVGHAAQRERRRTVRRWCVTRQTRRRRHVRHAGSPRPRRSGASRPKRSSR